MSDSDSDILSNEILSSDIIENPDDCMCDANVFYKKYKSQIDDLLAQHLADKKAFFAEQKKALEARKASFFNQSKVRGKKSSKFARSLVPEFLEPKSIDDGRRIRPSISRRMSTKSISSSSKSFIVKKESDHIDTLSKFSDTDKDLVVSVKEEEDIESDKEVQTDAVEFYALALNEKLRHLFDDEDGEEEAHTERGYLIFDRFVDRSEQSTIYKLSSISVSGEEMEGFFPFQPTQFEEEWMSESMRKALDYLKRHQIGELFKFLGAHLVSANPCNPIDFLINLLDTCLNYRSGYCDPPLLYLPKHIESLFHSMDPMETGQIELSQYHTGMFTLGIREYNMFPDTVDDMVQKHVFLNEAFNRLRIQLNEMIRSWETPPTTVSTFMPFYSIRAGESIPQ